MNIYNLIGNLLNEIESKQEDKFWEKYLKEQELPLFKIRKVLVVPYLISGRKSKYLTVLNKKFNEWGFICGTVEKNETYLDAAKRELYEETKKKVNIDISRTNHQAFDIYETIEHYNKLYKKKYTIVMVDVSNYKTNMEILEDTFSSVSIQGKEYNENSKLEFKTSYELCANRKTWALMKKIVNRKDFQQIVGQ